MVKIKNKDGPHWARATHACVSLPSNAKESCSSLDREASGSAWNEGVSTAPDPPDIFA